MRLLRTIAIVSAVFLSSLPMLAKDRDAEKLAWREKNPTIFSANFGICGYPEFASIAYGGGKSDSGPISYIYSDYRGAIMTTGVIGGEFNWNICRWFNASAYLGFCPVWNNVYDGVTNVQSGRKAGLAIYIMPKAKVMWCNTPMVRVYTSLSFGLSLLPGFSGVSSLVQPACQLNLAGLEIGRKWFGFCEIGAGTVFIGGKIGFGLKF